MPFLLRVDIDKPYGHHNFPVKLLSKIRENYYFPAFDKLGYLKPTIMLLNFLNKNNVPAFLYFRKCTIPNKKILHLIDEGKHILGFHAENTKTFESFKQEKLCFEKKLGRNVLTFTKHGSGTYKLGRSHYPKYEPDKYKKWAAELSIDYSFGNGIPSGHEDLLPTNGFFNNMFWLEKNYRNPDFKDIHQITSLSNKMLIPLIVHPSNFYTFPEVRNDLQRILNYSRENKIAWINKIPRDG